jgi:FHA domain/WD domain, G-beta repeat
MHPQEKTVMKEQLNDDNDINDVRPSDAIPLPSLTICTNSHNISGSSSNNNNNNNNNNNDKDGNNNSNSCRNHNDDQVVNVAHLVVPSGTIDITVSLETKRGWVKQNQLQQQQQQQQYHNLRVSSEYILYVGRQASTSDIRIQHGSISRKHAILYYRKSTNGSTSGTTTKMTNTEKEKESKVDDNKNNHNNNSYQLMVYDLGSKYGTTINGKRMVSNSCIELYNNDTIMFGNVRESIFTIQYKQHRMQEQQQSQNQQQHLQQQQQPPNEDIYNHQNSSSSTVHPVIGIQATITEAITKSISSSTNTMNNNDELDSQLRTAELIEDGKDDNNKTIDADIHSQIQSQPTTTTTTILQKDYESISQAGIGLSGRAKRQAEIKAMMDSLNDIPTYQPSSNDSSSNDTAAAAFGNDVSIEDDYGDNNNDEVVDPLSPIIQKYKLPISNQFIIPSESEKHNCSITCIVINTSGSRFAIGSTDYYLRQYDFNTLLLNSNIPSAVSSQIIEDGHWPVDASYNVTNDIILIGTTSVQPTVISSIDSKSQNHANNNNYKYDNDDPTNTNSSTTLTTTIPTPFQFVRGDMYVRDPTKTVGHTGTVTSVQCHPLESAIVITSSIDGSIRMWNIRTGKNQFQKFLTCDSIASIKNRKG